MMNKRLQLTFILLFISSLAIMSIPVTSQSTGNIIISTDGSVTETPAIVQNGNTYTLTTNITENILVQKISGALGIKVSNEMELNYAINNANGPTVIGLEKDITLTEQLVIPVNKDITLTSTSSSKFFKLIGGDTGRSTLGPAEYAQAVINVEGSGVLRIDGVSVTCGNYPLAWNKLVRVNVCGTLILYDGEISGNILSDGVINSGTFEMYGGKIANNTSIVGGGGSGGAVSNSEYGTFSMFGGEISNNTGFGVYNRGIFSMSGGLISNNYGGGVQNSGIFSLSGGEISNNVGEGENVMQSGGGVSNSGNLSMSGGVISNNQATQGGGVYNYPDGNFSLSENAVISNNNAEVGGGVYNDGTFTRHDGVISGNTATQYNEIYPNDDSTTDSDNNNPNSSESTSPNYTLAIVIVAVLTVIIALSASAVLIARRKKK